MIVVSDASPIISLAAIGRPDILCRLYDRVIIPQAVYREITVSGSAHPGATEIRALDWLQCEQVANRTLVTALLAELDEGEAEAITLAIERKADLLLLDERRGRIVASRLGLSYVGLLGVLMQAKHKGHVPAVKPILDDLMVKAGFWISQPLYASVLQAAGE
ncbi:MAG: DUF3368 domain-containing protein [Armatimonadetes bacterium]|nr:DUF3368 domain-containing protein [Armatimonadota bacterium]